MIWVKRSKLHYYSPAGPRNNRIWLHLSTKPSQICLLKGICKWKARIGRAKKGRVKLKGKRLNGVRYELQEKSKVSDFFVPSLMSFPGKYRRKPHTLSVTTCNTMKPAPAATFSSMSNARSYLDYLPAPSDFEQESWCNPSLNLPCALSGEEIRCIS